MSKFLKFTRKSKHYCSRPPSRMSAHMPVCWSVLVCLLFFAVAIFYLIQVNGMATLGFKLENLETRAQELERMNKKLESSVAELKSLSHIREVTQGLGMVEVGIVEYISTDDISVAIK